MGWFSRDKDTACGVSSGVVAAGTGINRPRLAEGIAFAQAIKKRAAQSGAGTFECGHFYKTA
jgi:hypothetical protein